MADHGGSVGMGGELSTLSKQDLLRAAEAVVDAALCRHQFEGTEVPEDTRRFLIQAVYEDPSLTMSLFQTDMTRFHCC